MGRRSRPAAPAPEHDRSDIDEALLAQARREWAANADLVRQEHVAWDGLAGDGLDDLA